MDINLLIRSGKIAELKKAAIPPNEDPTEAWTLKNITWKVLFIKLLNAEKHILKNKIKNEDKE